MRTRASGFAEIAESAREAVRRWRQRHPGAHAAEVRLFYRRHREVLLQRIADYHRARPEVRRAALQRRRARLVGAAGSYTSEQLRALVAACGDRCAYCGASGPLQVLSRHGSNDIANIVPACASWNLRKHTSTEEEFRRRIAEENR